MSSFLKIISFYHLDGEIIQGSFPFPKHASFQSKELELVEYLLMFSVITSLIKSAV